MAKYYDLNIPGSEVQRRLDLASHNVLAFDGILDVPVTASDELITAAESYQILYAPNGGRGEMLMSIGGTYYRNFRLQSSGKTYLDSSWYNEDGQIRKDRLFLNGAARDIYAYAAGSFGKVEHDGVDGQDGSDGITPHINPTTKHWMLGEQDTGIVAEGQDGQDGTDGIDGTDGKSAFDIWLENGHSGNISDFLAWMKDTSSMIGPKFAATTADCLMVNDKPTLYFVPNGTTFNVYLADSDGQGVSAHSLATGVPGDITNYAGIYDISQDKAVNGVPATYGNLSEALGAITEDSKKKGGMTIKFIQGTGDDAKYVQYRYTGTSIDDTDFEKEENWMEEGVSNSYDDVLNIETTEGTPQSGGVTTVVTQEVDTYQYTKNTYNNATMNDGHYYITQAYDKNYLVRVQTTNATAYIVEVHKGDTVTISLAAPTSYHVICFSPSDNRDNLESGAQSTDPNHSQVYEATAPYDGYAYISTRYGVSYIKITTPISPAVPPTKRSVRLDNIESSIGELDSSISDINDSITSLSNRIDNLSPSGDTTPNDETPKLSFYGERNGGTFTSNLNNSFNISNAGNSITVELLFRIETGEANIKIFSYEQVSLFQIITATSNNASWLRISPLIKSSDNSGEYLWIKKGQTEGLLCHVVLTASNDGTNIVKEVYVNNEKLITTSGTQTAYVTLHDDLPGGDKVTYFTKRIWTRKLSDADVSTLYNGGNPIEADISNLKTGLVSNLQSSGLSSDGWYDSVEDRTHILGANVILEESNPFASDDAPSGDPSDDTPSGDTSDLANRVTAIENRFGVFREITYPEFDVLTLTHNAHDCTFYDDDTILSAGWDGVGWLTWRSITTGTASVIKAQFQAESINTTYYNELKSIDYKFGKLLVGSGRAKKNDSSYETQGSYVLIFNDVADWKEISTTAYSTAPIKTLNNCGTYKKIDFDIALGVKSYAFWAHTDDTIYLNTNFFKDVYLIRLGKGTQKLESGIFTSVEEGLYNGSYEILNHWHQDEDWLQNGEPIAAHGGQFYRGHLFLAVNIVDKCVVYKCILNNDDTLRFDAIHLDEYMESNPTKLRYRYIDGLCFHDGKMYAQPLNVDDSNENNLSYYLVTEV